ncbi:MAG: DNA repair protein RecO [Granulosicoccaceae bacterium]|jgi:DNA repair protein RecO (recombination protein O)
MRVELQPAYILHRRPYRNTSLLVELFSKQYGRVGAIARGAQRSRSGMQSLIQPFGRVLVNWSGRGELLTLMHIEADGMSVVIDPTHTASAFYLNELIMRLLMRHDPHEALFTCYEQALHALAPATDSQHIQQALRLFEKRLLDELGYGLVLDHDAGTGEAIQADAEYYYVPDVGPVAMNPTLTGGVSLHGSSLLALAGEAVMDDRQLRESKRLMRSVLRQYLGDKPLQSRLMYNRIL